MKLFSIRPLLAISVATLLTACGGNIEQAAQIQAAAGQTAAVVQTSLNATQAMAATQNAAPANGSDAGSSDAAASVAVANAAVTNAALAAQAPQPDCAPEGCRGLRIIDANAEEYRLKAQRLAAAEMGGNTL
jgi:hypothetical protein